MSRQCAKVLRENRNFGERARCTSGLQAAACARSEKASCLPELPPFFAGRESSRVVPETALYDAQVVAWNDWIVNWTTIDRCWSNVCAGLVITRFARELARLIQQNRCQRYLRFHERFNRMEGNLDACARFVFSNAYPRETDRSRVLTFRCSYIFLSRARRIKRERDLFAL